MPIFLGLQQQPAPLVDGGGAVGRGGDDGPGEGITVWVGGGESERSVDIFCAVEGLGRQQGWIVDGGHDDVDCCFEPALGLAAAVADDDGEVVAAVLVFGPFVADVAFGIDGGCAFLRCGADGESEGVTVDAVNVTDDEGALDALVFFGLQGQRLRHRRIVLRGKQDGEGGRRRGRTVFDVHLHAVVAVPIFLRLQQQMAFLVDGGGAVGRGGGDGPGEGVTVGVGGGESEGAVDILGAVEGLGGQQGRVVGGSDDDVDSCFEPALGLAAAVADDDSEVIAAVLIFGSFVADDACGIDGGGAMLRCGTDGER